MLTFQVCIKLWKKNKSKQEKSPLHCSDKMPVDSMLPLKPGLRWLNLTRADNVTPRQHSRTYKIPNSTNTYILTEYFSSRQLIGVIHTNLNQPHSTHPMINILWNSTTETQCYTYQKVLAPWDQSLFHHPTSVSVLGWTFLCLHCCCSEVETEILMRRLRIPLGLCKLMTVEPRLHIYNTTHYIFRIQYQCRAAQRYFRTTGHLASLFLNLNHHLTFNLWYSRPVVPTLRRWGRMWPQSLSNVTSTPSWDIFQIFSIMAPSLYKCGLSSKNFWPMRRYFNWSKVSDTFGISRRIS